MLMFSDLNLNQFGDSVKMALKRTIVQHELIFKDQVHELHRLYWTQKNLMRELYCKELEAKVHSQSQIVDSAKKGNVGSLEEVKGKFIEVYDKRHSGFIRNSAKISIANEVIRPGYSGAKVTNDEKGGGMVEKGENLYCYEVIDLEGPVDIGFKIPRADCEAMGSLRSDNASDVASSSRIQNETGFVLELNNSQSACCEQWRENIADDHTGTGGSASGAAGDDVSTNSSHKQEPNSSKPLLIDLNIPQDDEFSHAVNDPMITFSSPSPISSVVQNEALWIDQCNSRNFKETSAALNSEAPHSASLGKSPDYLLPGSEDSPRSHVSAFGGKQDSKVDGTESKSLIEYCRKTVEQFPNIVATDNSNIDDNLANNATSDDGPDENFLTERKSDGLSGNTACTSLEKIMEENSETTQLDSSTLVGEEAWRHDEEDPAVIDAADILAGISLTQPSSRLERLFNNEKDAPEYSCDSFETMTLELPEVRSHEQHLIMATSQTGKETEEEEIAASRVSNKLRRGRGRAVRDFQKDVLPGMVSLLRHEICEDMHSIGKNGSRRGNRFLPVKSGRSRQQRH